MVLLKDRLVELGRQVPGDVSFYYKNLKTGEIISNNEEDRLQAASVIKIPILIKVLKEIEEGNISKSDRVRLREEDKAASCGALYYMDSGLEVTIRDLYTLMIIHSDNTATNMLIDMLGMDEINLLIKELGCSKTELNRKMLDFDRQKEGYENYTSSKDMGRILESIYREEMISKSISLEIERVMKLQRINFKLPYLLPRDVEIGHKTGEGSGVTNDVGIIYSKNPFVFCFISNNTDVIRAEDRMREMARTLYDYTNR